MSINWEGVVTACGEVGKRGVAGYSDPEIHSTAATNFFISKPSLVFSAWRAWQSGQQG